MGRVKKCYVCDDDDQASLVKCYCGRNYFCEYHVKPCFDCDDDNACYCPFCKHCSRCVSECPGAGHECAVCGCLFDDDEEKMSCQVCKDFVYHKECTSVCACGCGKVLCKTKFMHKCAEEKCTEYLCQQKGDYKNHLCLKHK